MGRQVQRQANLTSGSRNDQETCVAIAEPAKRNEIHEEASHLLLPFNYDYREAGLEDSQHHLYEKHQPLLTN